MNYGVFINLLEGARKQSTQKLSPNDDCLLYRIVNQNEKQEQRKLP